MGSRAAAENGGIIKMHRQDLFQPKTFEEAIDYVLDFEYSRLINLKCQRDASLIDLFESLSADKKEGWESVLSRKRCWVRLMWNVAKEMPRGFERDQVDLLIKKHKDYGPQNILKFGEYGIMVRVWDKIARIENLKRRISMGQAPQNEPLKDSYMDIWNYALIALMLSYGFFELPLKDDIK
jgi:hypothetical protein